MIGAAPDAVPGVLGDIVERTFTSGEESGATGTGSSQRRPQPALKPIQVTPGCGFPTPDPAKCYGLRSVAPTTASSGDGAALARQFAQGKPQRRVTFSAHVQPEEGPGSAYYTGNASSGGHTEAAGTSETQFLNLARQLEQNSGALPVGGSAASRTAMARQWTTNDFRALYEGYYTEPLPAAIVAAHAPPPAAQGPHEAPSGASTARPPTGEEFFYAVFQCLRSTVRAHQGIALDALILHLQNPQHGSAAATLRERCIHGPDCAPFLYFILNILSSAGHPFLCQQAAVCLVLLLQDEAGCGAPLSSVISEIGSPRADAATTEDVSPHESGDGRGAEGKEGSRLQTSEDDPDLPFSDLSEMLRVDAEMRSGLEKMGFTNHVMAAMNPLLFAPATGEAQPDGQGKTTLLRSDALRTLWLTLLCCGGLGESAVVSVRVAQDPRFLFRVVEPFLSAFVLGEPALSSSTSSPSSILDTRAMSQLLLVLYRLAHIPEALKQLLYNVGSGEAEDVGRSGGAYRPHALYETWTLYFIAVCTTKPSEVRSMEGVASIVLSFLVLREMARQGYERVLHDVCDALLSDGMAVGSAVVLEMWALLLSQSSSDSSDGGPSHKKDEMTSVEHLLRDAAQNAATHLSSSFPPSLGAARHVGERNDAAVQGALESFAALANRHYLATYLTTHRMTCFTLLGSTVETQSAMQGILVRDVLRSDLLSTAFAGLTGATGTPCAGRCGAGSLETVFDAVLQRRQRASHEDDLEPQRSISAKDGVFSFQAALLLANVRLAAAIPSTYPAVDAEAVYGYAAALSAKFQAACLMMRGDAQERLQLDELCTAVEILGILRSANTRVTSLNVGDSLRAGKPSEGVSVPPYGREARVMAVLIAHGIAVTKQCLDAAPQTVACMLGVDPEELEVSKVSRPLKQAAGVERTALALSLLAGVELTPIPQLAAVHSTAAADDGSRLQLSATGTPRSWVLHPLFDDTFAFKARWAEWLRQVLGLHQDMKFVLGWDGLLCHTLLWVLAHRGELFLSTSAATPEAGDEDEFSFEGVMARQNGAALAGLLLQLAELLLSGRSDLLEGTRGTADVGDRWLSPSAARVLSVALSDYTNPQAEEGLPRPLFHVLMVVATHADPAAALAVCQVILLTPVVTPPDGDDTAAAQRVAREVLSWRSSRAFVSSTAAGHLSGWGLESVVSLLQLTGPYLARGPELSLDSCDALSKEELDSFTDDAFQYWCVRALTFELIHRFLTEQQACKRAGDAAKGGRPTLSAMQRTVLRGTLEELDWEPEPLWSLVQE